MSSTYRLVCLSHDPALVITGPSWDKREGALVAVHRLETWGHSPTCDIVIGRYSYPLVEVICPGRKTPTHGLHTNDKGIDVGWLRLLAAARPALPDADALLGYAAACWPQERLRRLGPLLDDHAGAAVPDDGEATE